MLVVRAAGRVSESLYFAQQIKEGRLKSMAVCKDKNNPLSTGCFQCCPRFPPDETYQAFDPG